MAADDRIKARQSKELIKAVDELIKAQEELVKNTQRREKVEDGQFNKDKKRKVSALKATEEIARKKIASAEKIVAAEGKSAEEKKKTLDDAKAATVNLTKTQKISQIAVTKTVDALDKQSQSFINNIPGLKEFGDTLEDPAKKQALGIGVALAAATVEAIRWAKNIIKINQIAPLAFDNFFDGVKVTSELMFDMGLSADQLAEVLSDFPATFRKFQAQIGDTVDANEDLIFGLGISRETLASQTLAAIALLDAQTQGKLTQDQLNKGAREYVVELNVLARQTGRSADEVEAARRESVQSIATFLITLPKDVRGGMQNAVKEFADNVPQLSSQFNSIFESIDPSERLKEAQKFTVILKAATENIPELASTAKEFSDLTNAAAAGNREAQGKLGEATARMTQKIKDFVAGGGDLNAIPEALINAVGGQEVAKGFAELAAGVSADTDASRQSAGQRIKEGEALGEQAKKVQEITEDLGFWGEALLDGSKLLGGFGTDIVNIGVGLFGFLTAIAPIITAFGGFAVVAGALGTAFTFIGGVIATIAGAISLPVVAIVALGVGLFFLIKNFDEVSEVLQGMADSIGIWIDEAFQKFQELLPGIIDFMKNALGFVIELFTFLPRQILGFIVNLLPDGVKEFIDFLIGAARAVLPDFVANALFGEREDEGDTEEATSEQEKGESIAAGVLGAIGNFFSSEERDPDSVIAGGRGRSRITQGQANTRLGVTPGGVNFVGPTAPGGLQSPATVGVNQFGDRGQGINESDLDFLDRRGEEAKERRLDRHHAKVEAQNERIAANAEVQTQLQDKSAVSAEKTERNTNPNAPRRGGRGFAAG